MKRIQRGLLTAFTTFLLVLSISFFPIWPLMAQSLSSADQYYIDALPEQLGTDEYLIFGLEGRQCELKAQIINLRELNGELENGLIYLNSEQLSDPLKSALIQASEGHCALQGSGFDSPQNQFFRLLSSSHPEVGNSALTIMIGYKRPVVGQGAWPANFWGGVKF